MDVLRSAGAILAEDTRRTRQLLQHYGVSTPMLAYHEHNEARTIPRILARLAGGEDLALVSDAGTPLVSDPGARLVRAAAAAGIPVVPVPGASAVLAALTGAGLEGERFSYFGFLPRKGRDRAAALRAVLATDHVVVLYEAPGRVAATLGELSALGAGDRQAVIARELTKRFEEFRRGTVGELAAYYGDTPPRGEVVILLGPIEEAALDEAAFAAAARDLTAQGLSARDVAAQLVRDHAVPRNFAYRIAQEASR